MKENKFSANIIKEAFLCNWDEKVIFDSHNDVSLTGKELLGIVLYFAGRLRDAGFKKGDIICILLPNSLELLLLYFASLVMELVVVPLDLNKGEDEIKFIISKLNYHGVITDENFDYINNKISTRQFRGLTSGITDTSTDDLNIFDCIDFSKLFLINFTSGTTGFPKGVMHSYNNLVLSADAFRKKLKFGENNIFYHNLPMAYMAGILNLIILPFISKSKIVIGERFSVSGAMKFWDIPEKYSVNTFWFIPTIISILLKLDRGTAGIEYLKKTHPITGCIGTAPLSLQLKSAFEAKYGFCLYESYGLTETLFLTTNHHKKERINTVGEVLDGVKLSFGEDKEILVQTPWMSQGYFKDQIQNFCTDGKFKTGDLGQIDSDGFLSITGRKKDLIIRGGINISPKRIENFVSDFNLFEECVILGLRDDIVTEKISCFFVPSEKFTEDKKNLLNKEIAKKLGRDYCIDEFIKLTSMPLNVNGKIDKLKLKRSCKKLIR